MLFDPQTLWEGLVSDPKINRDGRAWEVGPLDYTTTTIMAPRINTVIHFMSVMEKVAAQIHALNKKVTNDPRVAATILPLDSCSGNL